MEENEKLINEKLNEQIYALLEKVGEGYGGPLLDELIRRLEKTVSDFNEEVTGLITTLKDNSKSRRQKLNRILKDGENLPLKPIKANDLPTEVSEFEKRLENKSDKSTPSQKKKSQEEPKRKRRIFKRNKK